MSRFEKHLYNPEVTRITLEALKVLERANPVDVNVVAILFKPGVGWGTALDTRMTGQIEIFTNPNATPEDALNDTIAHTYVNEPIFPAPAPDALRQLERVDCKKVKSAGIDYTPGMGWGWQIETVASDRGAAMGFEDTPEEALADLISYLTTHLQALPVEG